MWIEQSSITKGKRGSRPTNGVQSFKIIQYPILCHFSPFGVLEQWNNFTWCVYARCFQKPYFGAKYFVNGVRMERFEVNMWGDADPLNH